VLKVVMTPLRIDILMSHIAVPDPSSASPVTCDCEAAVGQGRQGTSQGFECARTKQITGGELNKYVGAGLENLPSTDGWLIRYAEEEN
jgi:hypothetical protein